MEALVKSEPGAVVTLGKRQAWIVGLTVAMVALALLAAGSRYTVTECQLGAEPAGDGCYVLDRWTGEVEFRRQ